MSVLDKIGQSWKTILAISVLVLFAIIIYRRIIKDNEIFEEFEPALKCSPQLAMLPNIGDDAVRNLVQQQWDGKIVQMNKDRAPCSNYILSGPVISKMYDVADMCHSDRWKDQLNWNCFYRYELEKNLLKDPNWAKDLYRKDFGIFYKV